MLRFRALNIQVPVSAAPATAHAGLRLEPQAFPDSPNRRHFTDCVLTSEDEGRRVSEFRFA